MFSRAHQRITRWYQSCEVPKRTYANWRRTLLVPDMVFSRVAQHSYYGYRFWDEWMRVTARAYPTRRDWNGILTAEQFEWAPKIIDQLNEQGVAVIENAFPSDWLEVAREYILSLYNDAQDKIAKIEKESSRNTEQWEGDSGIIMEYGKAQARFRCYFPNDETMQTRLPEVIRDFMQLPISHRIIEEYYGMAVTPSRPYTMAEILMPGTEVQEWHIDCLRKGSKAFLYLTNVSEKQGPLRYLLGTNRPNKERHEQLYRVGRSGLDESYFDEATNRKFDEQGQSFLAPANTLILFDNRGIHAGSRCTEGMRVTLVNGFRPAYSTRINPRFLPRVPDGK